MAKRQTATDILSVQSDEHKLFSTPEEQALHRPGLWIGSTKSNLKSIAILQDGEFIDKELEIIPAVAKLIEEVIVNSSDEHLRTKDKSLRGWTLDKIHVKLDEHGNFSVHDNGGITTKRHSTGLLPVEVIFGEFFSSSNYEDNKERVTVGLNGLGSSLSNLFSKRFKVTSADAKQCVEVTWSENKSIQSEPIITECSEHFTRIEAELDLARFDIETIPYGIIKYIERLSMLLAAANPGLEVTFNDDVYAFKNFKEYVDMYNLPVIGEKNASWEIYMSPTNGSEAKRYAIVNGAECNSGTHIQHIEMLMNWHLTEALKRAKITNITAQQIKASYTVFMNISIDKPEYSSQSKTELTNSIYRMENDKKKNLARSVELQKQIESGAIFQSLVQWSKDKEQLLNSKEFQKRAKELKSQSAKTIKKLIDAGAQKKSERKDCELWIFEGQSAGSGFRSGNADPKHKGCYFLKGKCLNTIEMSTMKVLGNEEFSDIVVALGLNVRNQDDLSGLRFGKIIVSTDADQDGASIFGQVMTLFAIHFPSIVKAGMLYRAISPIYRVTKGSDKKYFYSVKEFEEFSEKNKGWHAKQFKGLGSLTKDDYKVMLNASTLERMILDDKAIETITAFMGSNSAPRKRLLESEV